MDFWQLIERVAAVVGPLAAVVGWLSRKPRVQHLIDHYAQVGRQVRRARWPLGEKLVDASRDLYSNDETEIGELKNWLREDAYEQLREEIYLWGSRCREGIP